MVHDYATVQKLEQWQNMEIKMERNKEYRLHNDGKHQERQRKIWQQRSHTGEISQRILGAWRKQSAMDCGRTGCYLCSNPRRVNKKDKLTIQEKKQFGLFDSYMQEMNDKE